jgi:4-amino-4-deoxy-L-arabinose transferase-like glycosyltransferase
MIDALLPWGLLLVVIFSALPWSAWLLAHAGDPVDLLLAGLLAVGLSAGGLTLLMFWWAVAGLSFDAAGLTAIYLLLMAPGAILLARQRPPIARLRLPDTGTEWLALLALLAIGGAILFNAVYWPFSRDDVLGIYDPFAEQMAETRALIPLPGDETLYEAYPPLMPLTYAYTYLLAGWHHDYVARLLPALLSLGCLGAAYQLGDLLRGRRAAYLSALLLALTPTYVRWASSGYVDLPMAFYYTLTVVFMLRLWRDGRMVDALLAGIMLGLATWTKNAALLGVPVLAGALLAGINRARFTSRAALLALFACALIGGPWYIRNLLGAGLIIPDTAWTEQAQHTLDALLIYITRPQNFGLSGPVMLLALIAAALRPRRAMTALLWWIVPFFAAWWLFVSYDPRFLLLFLPLTAAVGGVWLSDVWDNLATGWQRRLIGPAYALLLALTLYSIWIGVEYKDNLLRDPLMSDAAKRIVVQGD